MTQHSTAQRSVVLPDLVGGKANGSFSASACVCGEQQSTGKRKASVIFKLSQGRLD